MKFYEAIEQFEAAAGKTDDEYTCHEFLGMARVLGSFDPEADVPAKMVRSFPDVLCEN